MTNMLKTGVAIIVVLMTAGGASAQDQAQIDRGQKVFAAQKCSICHSIAGVGNKNGPLNGVGAKYSAEVIRQWLVAAPEMAAKTKAVRKPLMKAYAALPKEDLDGLVAYLQSLK